ncbi:biotin transporter BioY [uncultured Oscillibacter sp.]|uniref:biotin transporter BioY n=1 Tax=uncultured Oscillibacter sp. TaxID=876091 RepID=UPI001F92F3A8|nr:biotin transporter BioY [uncultured Oscillibacter sp.]HJB32703.1 biotin transporter BioY [Candidatus Oscillibacter excrementavium]
MVSAKSKWRAVDLAYTALFAVLMMVCAWITVPLTVPFTLQTFGVFAALGTLGGRRGTYAVAAYLLLGLAGLPVFSGFRGGPGVLLGTTGGYILGFLALALLYWAVTARLGQRPVVMAAAMVLGLVVCYAFGTAWFLVAYARTAGSIGLWAALGMCVFPFVVPDLAKIALAMLLSRQLAPQLR